MEDTEFETGPEVTLPEDAKDAKLVSLDELDAAKNAKQEELLNELHAAAAEKGVTLTPEMIQTVLSGQAQMRPLRSHRGVTKKYIPRAVRVKKRKAQRNARRATRLAAKR